jgi:hypothetical protein
MTDENPDADHEGRPGPSPYDTPVSSGLRFVMELVAWTAGPWAAADLADNAWVAIPALVVLVAVPGVFSTPGDKHSVVVPTPGPVRVGLELLLFAVAVAGAWIVWPDWAAILVTLVAIGALITGRERTRWLLAGAPPVGSTDD